MVRTVLKEWADDMTIGTMNGATQPHPTAMLDRPLGEIVAAVQTHDNGHNPDRPGWLDGTPMNPLAVPSDPLPSLAGFPYLYRGKHEGSAALISGPTGGGRSSLVQAGAYDVARAGLRVAYLGSEVGREEFNARAANLAERRGDTIDEDLCEQLRRVAYLDLWTVIERAWNEPAEWVAGMRDRFDVVVIDPLSIVASALGLDFDKSNAEFTDFFARLIQPLVDARVCVVMLDNIGHAIEARTRAKGASSKADKADVTVSCKSVPAGLMLTIYKPRSERAPFNRGDTFTFDRDTRRITASVSTHISAHDNPGTENNEPGTDEWRPTFLMERVSKLLEDQPNGLSKRTIRDRVKGQNGRIDQALDHLVGDGYVTAGSGAVGKANPYVSTHAYREGMEPRTGTVPTVPQPCPGHGQWDRAPRAPPLRGHGARAHPLGAHHRAHRIGARSDGHSDGSDQRHPRR